MYLCTYVYGKESSDFIAVVIMERYEVPNENAEELYLQFRLGATQPLGKSRRWSLSY